MNKFSVSFVWRASFVAVTVTSTVQVLKAATVMFENDKACWPSVNEAGEGEAPHPV